MTVSASSIPRPAFRHLTYRSQGVGGHHLPTTATIGPPRLTPGLGGVQAAAGPGARLGPGPPRESSSVNRRFAYDARQCTYPLRPRLAPKQDKLLSPFTASPPSSSLATLTSRFHGLWSSRYRTGDRSRGRCPAMRPCRSCSGQARDRRKTPSHPCGYESCQQLPEVRAPGLRIRAPLPLGSGTQPHSG